MSHATRHGAVVAPAPSASRSRPLEGVRVADLSRLVPGPFATLLLADLGARVDKIEDVAAGDYLRRVPPLEGGTNATFTALNRGKRSLAIDLKRDEGRRVFERLLGGYDVIVSSFRPGVLDKLGLAPARLERDHPGLVVCLLSGYGQEGPLATRAGHDLNYLARAGILGRQGPASDVPAIPAMQAADVGGALFAALSTVAALFARERTGRGSVLDVSLAEAAASFAPFALAAAASGAAGAPPRAAGLLEGGVAPYGTYRTADGGYVALAALEPKFWADFCRVAGLPFDATALAPGPGRDTAVAAVRDAIARRTRAEWETLAAEHDLCLEPVLRSDELAEDPWIRARGWFTATLTGGFATPVTPRPLEVAPVPSQGEHTEQILREAGFAADEIGALVATGALRG